MGRKIERGEKRRKSHSRSTRNIRKFPLFSFFLVGVEGKKTWGRGEDQRKESCEIKIPI